MTNYYLVFVSMKLTEIFVQFLFYRTKIIETKFISYPFH